MKNQPLPGRQNVQNRNSRYLPCRISSRLPRTALSRTTLSGTANPGQTNARHGRISRLMQDSKVSRLIQGSRISSLAQSSKFPGSKTLHGRGQPNPDSKCPWQNQQPYPTAESTADLSRAQNQQTYPGHQNQPPYQDSKRAGTVGNAMAKPTISPIFTYRRRKFYPNQNPNFQSPNMQTQNMQNMQGPNIPNPNLPEHKLSGTEGDWAEPPVNPMAATSRCHWHYLLLVSCCCSPVGLYQVGFVLANGWTGTLAISSKEKKESPSSGYANKPD